ncbi:hypothetical protein [Arthrobacter sp. SLBN-112]|uniref:hypothetical protein n=1 Tax=Arthrobacter sp. SLBN-112 TaxID=2768452 RepID=UPI0027AF556B|nr:hypothetical protein [Arthrobacter sp. SLBN-112]MDQ0799021.1 hypothetical protein [Arthrobacter sp. SLBN-112]
MAHRDTQIVLEITATDRTSMERQLHKAESIARQEAMKERKYGVLVTRHSLNRFTVAVSESVPFGLTQELSSW